MTENRDSLPGFVLAITVYGLWGFLPIYMHALGHIGPAEVLAHRVIWSVPVAALVLWAGGQARGLGAAIRTPRMLGMAAVTAVLVSLNWGIYVWAVGSGHALDAALGYYINPLFSVLLGAILLREKLSGAQMVAIGLAAGAVVVLAVDAGRLPMAALGLTFTWGFYAFFKKWLPIGASEGFLLEVLILLVPAIGYVWWLTGTGQGHFAAGSPTDTWLLLGCGIVTAVPLMIYAHAAKRLRLSTIGILQYIAPTLIVLTATLVLGEEFGHARMIAFPMIWAALAIYTLSMVRQARQARAGALAEVG